MFIIGIGLGGGVVEGCMLVHAVWTDRRTAARSMMAGGLSVELLLVGYPENR